MLKWLLGFILTASVAVLHSHGGQTATLLPPGKNCFEGANGAYVSGSVNMFIPNTTTPKATWQDAAQTVLNSQPIQLDSNGCAIIYGIGSYRQQLFDGPVLVGVTTGNLIWDQITTDTSASNSVFWAGVAGGTPNAITITDPGFNGTDGTVINFTANATNTGATTINPSAFGAISVLKDTTAGPAALTGGEIIQTNPISVVYRANDNAFHLLNTVVPSVSASTAPLCGAVGYRVVNNAGFPNTRLDISASQVLMLTGTGVVINRAAVGVTINFGTNGANGLDTGALAPNVVYSIWLIDNGAAPAAIATLAGSPSMPAGYTFKCRLSSAPTDGSSNIFPIITTGSETQFAANAVLPTISGPVNSGTCPNAFTQTFFLQIPVSATYGSFRITNSPSTVGVVNALGASLSGPILSGVSQDTTGKSFEQYARVALNPAQTTYYCSSDSTANSNLKLLGWTEPINAH
jgi:hypothetical protein